MASASSQSNPWAMRIGIFGLICIFISAIMLFSQTDAIDNAFNPRNMSEIKVTGENSEIGELDVGCHIAVGLDDEEYGKMTLKKMIGSSPSSDSIDTTSCATDWQPMDSSGQEYYFVEEWDVTEKGEYVLSMECSSDIDCDKEIYNRKVLFPKLFLKHRNRVFRSKVYGFKLLSYQLREKLGQEDGRDFLKYLVEKQGYKLIYLTRDNLVRQTLSKHYARFRMSWHETQSLKSRPKMRVDIPAFMAELRAGKELEQYEEKCLEGLHYFKVSYEKDLMKASDRIKLVDRLYHYLGVRLFKPQSRLKRISADHIGDYVENWEALKQCLVYTEFAEDLKKC
mgnify:CR=1 FL=1